MSNVIDRLRGFAGVIPKIEDSVTFNLLCDSAKSEINYLRHTVNSLQELDGRRCNKITEQMLDVAPEVNPVKTYTFKDVEVILCEGCRKGLDGMRDERRGWTHVVNGMTLECLASKWRDLEALKQ